SEPELALDLHRLKHNTRALATEAWEQQFAGREDNRDFRDGYIDGYADYLESGGSGDAVAAPPRRYQRVRRGTPTDMRAAADYFAGFQQGTADALASGQRALLLVPVVVPSADCAHPEPPQFAPAAETLPAPEPAKP
ncbi:MAG: hypothetical protein ACJ8F7_01610, partial [Gemmataceae bacterium]